MFSARRILDPSGENLHTGKRHKLTHEKYAAIVAALPAEVADRVLRMVYTAWLRTGDNSALCDDFTVHLPRDSSDAEYILLERLSYVFMWIQAHDAALACLQTWHRRHGKRRRFACHDAGFSLLHLCTPSTPVRLVRYLIRVLKCNPNQPDLYGRPPLYCVSVHATGLSLRGVPICWEIKSTPGLLTIDQAYRVCFYKPARIGNPGSSLEVCRALIEEGANPSAEGPPPSPRLFNEVSLKGALRLVQSHERSDHLTTVELDTALCRSMTVEAPFVLACALTGALATCQMAWLWQANKGGALPSTVRVRQRWAKTEHLDVPILQLLIGSMIDDCGWLIERLLVASADPGASVNYTYGDMLLDACSTLKGGIVELVLKYFPRHSTDGLVATPYHRLVKSPVWMGAVPGSSYRNLTDESCRIIRALRTAGFASNAVDGTGTSSLDWLARNLPHHAVRDRNSDWWTELCDSQVPVDPVPSLQLMAFRRASVADLRKFPSHVLTTMVVNMRSPCISLYQLMQ